MQRTGRWLDQACPGTTQAREVLDARGYTCRAHATDERRAVGGHRPRGASILSIEGSDRRVDRAGRNHVDDRSQVEGHPGLR